MANLVITRFNSLVVSLKSFCIVRFWCSVDLISLFSRIMIMTDQDQDGSHIKGLIINFVHNNWPNLLRHNIVEEFITPIVKVFKGKHELPFYSLPEFEEWQKSTPNWHTWRVKYYKGLFSKFLFLLLYMMHCIVCSRGMTLLMNTRFC